MERAGSGADGGWRVEGSRGTSGSYKEILFLPTRNLRTETYTGAKMDAASPGVAQATGVDAVQPMTELPAELNKVIAADRRAGIQLVDAARCPNRPRRW